MPLDFSHNPTYAKGLPPVIKMVATTGKTNTNKSCESTCRRADVVDVPKECMTTKLIKKKKKKNTASQQRYRISCFLGEILSINNQVDLYELLKEFTFSIPFFVGIITSFLVGIFVIKFLLEYLKKGSLKIFAIYRIIFGIVIILRCLIMS